MKRRRLWFGLLIILCGMALSSAAFSDEEAYIKEITIWRHEREERLKADQGWLTVAGLYWLKEGVNQVGADPTNDMVLPVDSAPPHVGVFEFQNGKTTFRAAEGVEVRQHGEVVRTATLEPGPGTGAAPADALVVRGLTLWVHKSGDRFAIRLRDHNSKLRREFTGCQWFPVDPAYRVTARFVPYDAPKAVAMLNILGDLEHYTSPGHVVFELHGQELRLEPVSSGQDRLFFVFRDGTSGKETYGAARFLVTDGPQDGQVSLDFNTAYNPPCAFNPFTTCPLPPKANRLPVRIEAGELSYKKGSST